MFHHRLGSECCQNFTSEKVNHYKGEFVTLYTYFFTYYDVDDISLYVKIYTSISWQVSLFPVIVNEMDVNYTMPNLKYDKYIAYKMVHVYTFTFTIMFLRLVWVCIQHQRSPESHCAKMFGTNKTNRYDLRIFIIIYGHKRKYAVKVYSFCKVS